jgi:hypothetical protein
MTSSLGAILRVAVAEARRVLTINARYRLEFVASVGAFCGAFFAFRFVAGILPGQVFAFGGDVHHAVLLYLLWIWSYTVIAGVQAQVLADLDSGAIEPMLAALGNGVTYVMGRTLGVALQSLLVCAVLLVAVCLFGGAWPASTAWTGVAASFLLALCTSMGIASAVAGLVYLFKRVSLVMMPLSILLMWVMMTPADDHRLSSAALLPYLAPKGILLGAFHGSVEPDLLVVGAINAAILLAAGIGIHSICEARAKSRGRLSTA